MKASGAIKSVNTATEEKRNIKHSETSRNGGCKEFSYTFWGTNIAMGVPKKKYGGCDEFSLNFSQVGLALTQDVLLDDECREADCALTALQVGVSSANILVYFGCP